MNVGVLTSSRADFGIYLPLLRRLRQTPNVTLKIFAFGTHLSPFYGQTVQEIERNGFEVTEKIETVLAHDTASAVTLSMAITMQQFAAMWPKQADSLDVVLALGDRYEMFAAVSSSAPFNIPIAHLHGGETTLGAIDNRFRHAITQFATLHFASTKTYADKIAQMLGHSDGVFHVGSLSLDNLQDMDLLSAEAFLERYGIDLRTPTILTTFHPETVRTEGNVYYAEQIVKALDALSATHQILLTMPNADTAGTVIRNAVSSLSARNSKVFAVESLGVLGYFSAMRHCAFLLGNTSSGIIEAASLGKYVVNVGDRQKGRAQSANILDCAFKAEAITATAERAIQNGAYTGGNLYQAPEGLASDLILKQLLRFAAH